MHFLSIHSVMLNISFNLHEFNSQAMVCRASVLLLHASFLISLTAFLTDLPMIMKSLLVMQTTDSSQLQLFLIFA